MNVRTGAAAVVANFHRPRRQGRVAPCSAAGGFAKSRGLGRTANVFALSWLVRSQMWSKRTSGTSYLPLAMRQFGVGLNRSVRAIRKVRLKRIRGP